MTNQDFESAKLKLAASKESGGDVNLTNSEAQALYGAVASMSIIKFSKSTPCHAIGLDQDVLEKDLKVKIY